MNSTDFLKIANETMKDCLSTLEVKADEYAKIDRLAAFKAAASIQGCSSVKALAGMMAKHTVSIYKLCGDYDKGDKPPLGQWDEKIKDHINYLLLLKALLEEEMEQGEENYYLNQI